VIVFSVGALIVLAVLALRRMVVGAELGGPRPAAWGTAIFFVLIWVTYVTISTLISYELIKF